MEIGGAQVIQAVGPFESFLSFLKNNKKTLKSFNQGNDLVNLHLKDHSACDMEILSGQS